jgi:hypothetical protein
MFYVTYICIQGGPQGAKRFEREKTLEQVTKIFIAVVECVKHSWDYSPLVTLENIGNYCV